LCLLVAPVACQDALNPQFLASLGETTSALPQPGSAIILLVVNQTVWPASLDHTITPRTGTPEAYTLSMGPEMFVPLMFECGVSQISFDAGTVYTSQGAQAVNVLPPNPLTAGTEFICGAVIKVFIYPWVDASGNPDWEVASETVLD
jgi:hypothetical protein